MKTNLAIMPAVSPSGFTSTDIASWTTKLDVETDVNYDLKIQLSGRTYQGSLKLLAENTANNAGTRRLLLKVDVPLVYPSEDATTCCCCGEKGGDSGNPVVSAHLVLTVPKSVATGIASSNQVAKDHVAAAIRLLQAAFASSLTQAIEGDDVADQTVFAENVILVRGNPPDGGNAVLQAPLYHNPSTDRVICAEVPSTAPIWGFVGGLRALA